tara:strand:+ start:2142 stop:2894 length:753 start_codon:yes stop_codon:yes gene_type:complete
MKTGNKNLIQQYNSKGWVKIKNLVSKKDIYKINYNLDKFLKKTIKKYKGRDINFATNNNKAKKYINSFHKLADSDLIRNGLAKKNNITKFANYFLQNKSKFMASELFAKPAKYGLPSPVHQDNYYWCVKNSNALTIWIALDKVSKSNGGVCYYEKSHRAGLLKHKPSYAKGSSQKIASKSILAKFKKKFPSLNPGDALVHHCLTIHGSGKNKTNFSRRGLTLQFRAKNSSIDKMLKKNYEQQLKKQIKTR